MSAPTLSLHRKLAQIMYEAERIPKNGTAPVVMGGYKFVQVGDAADYIRKALAEHVLTMLPTAVRIVGQVDRPTKNGGMMTTVDLVTTWTITDGESGESITVESFGAGADGGDKYSGKASTSAMKYALLTTFLLSTGDDTELGSHEAAAPTPPPAADDKEPILVPLGIETHEGKVTRGDGRSNDCVYHAHPDGFRFGFRLAMADGKALPQVVAQGAIGLALHGLVGEEIVGQHVKVTGEAFRVEQRGRRAYRRLVVHAIEGDGWRAPAPDAGTGVSVAPGAAPNDLDGLDW